MRRSAPLVAAAALACLALAACSGGGGGSGAAPPDPTTSAALSSASPPSASSYTISGAVVGAAGVATVKLTGVTNLTTQTDANGNFSFASVGSGSYTVTPTQTGYVFNPVSSAATVSTASLSGIYFSGTASTAPAYNLSGAVTGAITRGVIITLNGANVGSAATDLGGNYSFAGLPIGSYTVSAALPGYSFTSARIVTLGAMDSESNDFTSTVAAAGGDLAFSPVNPLPQAVVGLPYSNTVTKTVAGGNPPYRFQTGTPAAGVPPLGMILNPNGDLTGTAGYAGTYGFSVCVADSAGNTTAQCLPTSITVAESSASSASGGTSWVYANGLFDWPGDYSFAATVDYSDTSGEPLSGAYDIKITLISAWGAWLPYAQNYDFNSKPYTKLTFALKPTVSAQQWNVYFVAAGDVSLANGCTQNVLNYGPAPVVGQWGTYSIPLSALCVAGTSIYKFAIQDQTGLSSNEWYVDNVGFVP
jgi:hypothetical protein